MKYLIRETTADGKVHLHHAASFGEYRKKMGVLLALAYAGLVDEAPTFTKVEGYREEPPPPGAGALPFPPLRLVETIDRRVHYSHTTTKVQP